MHFSGEIIERKIQGRVKWFNVDRGFGFIIRSDNGEEVYVNGVSKSQLTFC